MTGHCEARGGAGLGLRAALPALLFGTVFIWGWQVSPAQAKLPPCTTCPAGSVDDGSGTQTCFDTTTHAETGCPGGSLPPGSLGPKGTLADKIDLARHTSIDGSWISQGRDGKWYSADDTLGKYVIPELDPYRSPPPAPLTGKPSHLGIYITPNGGTDSGALLGAGGYTARNSSYGLSDAAGVLAPGTTTGGYRETVSGGAIGATYDASYLVGPNQKLIWSGSFDYARSSVTYGPTAGLIALGIGTGAGTANSDNYSFGGSVFYSNYGTYAVASAGYNFGRGSEFQTVDNSSGSYDRNGYFVDARVGHLFVLMNTISTPRPMVAKAPVKPVDGYVIGLDLSGHLGYFNGRDGGFTDNTGFIYGTEQVHFGDAGLRAKLVAFVPRNGVLWQPYIAATADTQLGFSHTSYIPAQVALATGDVVSFSQATSFVGAQVGLDVKARNGWLVGVNCFYSRSSDTEVVGGRAFVKIPLGPTTVAARY